MNDQLAKGHDYTQTLYLPQTGFPMRAGLPKKEPEVLAHWETIDLYGRLRALSKGRAKFVLHDGPPYANGNIHIGHALNKILKDVVTRSQQMLGKDSNYVPGWDCHGLPIEWKIEEQYRAKGKNKDDVPIGEFRRQCRAFADHWLSVQREEFKRLGVLGDWAHPYSTMSFAAEAQIVREILKFAANGTLYRGSKPVMWSVVEKTALAEAEVEYEDYISDTVYVAFPVRHGAPADWPNDTAILIWTTTPWTIPGNRAIAFSLGVDYSLYRVLAAPAGNWVRPGTHYVVADQRAEEVFKAARVDGFERVARVTVQALASVTSAHPLAGFLAGYDFAVPLLAADHVSAETGTGFVHTAPGHGREDFDLWMASAALLSARGIDTKIPYTVDPEGYFTNEANGFVGKRVITARGEKGDANEAVISALASAHRLAARGRLKHQYPHSWRSKKPVIFRNTPQWFIAMDKPIQSADGNARHADSLRHRALEAIRTTRWVPASGENRIRGMIENRPDWVVSRQRTWGVPIAVFVRKGTDELLVDSRVNERIAAAFDAEGADAWFADPDGRRFLCPDHDPSEYEKIDDVLDVWFDSGSSYAFTLEDPVHFPGLAGIHRRLAGGRDEVMYLEGSDQHRGWFHSSLLESCGTRGHAPFDVVLTHGFVLDERGQKMSKSLGNVTAPQDVIKDAGADILRLWVCASDYVDDLRIGAEILKTFVETYRKLRNTIRWMLGSLAHFSEEEAVDRAAMPELERLMLHRLSELDAALRDAYAAFDYKRVVALISHFMTNDLSAFYFDIRKDTLYCDPPSSIARKSALTAIDVICDAILRWLAPILVFTCDEAWLSYRADRAPSVHLMSFRTDLSGSRDDALAAKWDQIKDLRRVVTGALEVERAQKRIGSSLEAAPIVYIADPQRRAVLIDIDFAEVCITSQISIEAGEGPAAAFRLSDVAGVAVVPARAAGRKCARSWRYSPLVGSDAEFPDVTPRDAAALRELRVLGRWQ
jgi:isoleucyl-tRNA synthetase